MWMYYIGEICWWVRLFSWVLLFVFSFLFVAFSFFSVDSWKEVYEGKLKTSKTFREKYPVWNDDALILIRSRVKRRVLATFFIMVLVLIFVPSKDKIEEMRSQQEIQLLKKD